jgi:hypothetical protein
MVISTVYPDGTVAALEELIGSHGGVGGEQTDAFILHPPDMEVPDTRNSIDVFHILNNHRGQPVLPRKSGPEAERVADWAPENLARGLRQGGTWLGRALRALLLERSAYEEIVRDPYMTGPALLISLVTLLLTSLTQQRGLLFSDLLIRIGLWLVQVVVVFGAGFLISRRGTFTRTFRALGFAQSVYVFQPLALIPVVAPVIRVAILFLGFLMAWMGAATAHEIRGWRAIILPILAMLILGVGSAVLNVLFASIGLTVEAVLTALGLQPM